MSERNSILCLICGGHHAPHPQACSDAGMDKQIKKLGTKTWNRLTAMAQRKLNKCNSLVSK